MRYIILAVFLMCSLTGCTISPPETGQYSTDTAMSAMEYSMFMNKQMTICASQMTARMTAVQNLKESTCATEIVSAKESLSMIKEIKNSILTTMPPKTYSSTREVSIQIVDTVILHLQNYISDLDVKKDVSSYGKIFQNDFNELTSQSNLYNY